MAITLDRRKFLKSMAASTLPAFAAGAGWGQPNLPLKANERITLGCIGLGIHGMGWNLDAFLKIPDARVLAVCDVFKDRREKGAAKVNEAYGSADCAVYNDFREILARDDIDAVVISTPDHWHVLMSVMAARAGKDVFCEKPTLNIAQGQKLVEVIRETSLVYQGGLEDRSVEQYHRLAEIVRNGRIGKLERILVTLPSGTVYEKEEEAPVPEGLDYDLWLGPAPYTPYTPSKLEAQPWRNVWDYSGGKLTDWGAHLIDTAQVAMDAQHTGPVEIDGKGEFPVNALSNTATEYEIHYRYANGVEMAVKSGGTGIRFEGTEGWVECPEWRKDLTASDPKILETSVESEENKMWPRPPSEHVDFIDTVKNRTTPTYPPEDIHRLSAVMHLGNISMRLARKLKWNPEMEEFEGDDEAAALLSCPMREPWTLEADT